MEKKRSYKRKNSKRKSTKNNKNKGSNTKKYSRFKMNLPQQAQPQPMLISSNELRTKPYVNYTNRTVFVFNTAILKVLLILYIKFNCFMQE